MCTPVSQTRPESSESELFDDSNFPSRRHCGSPSFLRDSSFQEQGMCAPVSQTRPDSSGGESFDVSNLPSRKHHRSRSPQGEADSYQLELHPSHVEMWNAIRGLLHLEVPRVECLVAPASS